MNDTTFIGLDRADLQRRVGAELRRIRIACRLSQEEIAWAVGVTQGTISNYESGRSDIPVTTLIVICRALKVSPVDTIESVIPNYARDNLSNTYRRYKAN